MADLVVQPTPAAAAVSSGVSGLSEAAASRVAAPLRPRKRGRIGRACLQCRRRKVACNNEMPCKQCLTRGEANLCTGTTEEVVGPGMLLSELITTPDLAAAFSPASTRSVDFLAKRLHAFEARLGSVEKLLASNPFTSTSSKSPPPSSPYDLATSYSSSDCVSPTYGPDASAAADTLMEAAVADVERRTLALPTPPQSASTGTPRSTASAPALHPFWEAAGMTTVIDARPSRSPLLSLGGSAFPLSLQAVLLASLPPPEKLDVLISHFKDNIDPLLHVLHGPTFDGEYTEFKELWKEEHAFGTEGVTLDVTWLASLAAAAMLGCEHRTAAVTNQLGWVENECEEWSERLFALTQMALATSDWLGRPSVRALQAIILFSSTFQHPGSPFTSTLLNGVAGAREPSRHGDWRPFRFWLGAAVTVARQLGLDQLGEEPDTMPIDDPAWPPGCSTLKREMACRLWCCLVMLDLKTSNREQHAPLILDNSYTTALPARVKDIDLAASVALIPGAPGDRTEADSHLVQHELRRHVARVATLPVSTDLAQYSAVQELHSHLQEVITRLGLDQNFGDMSTIASLSAIHNQILRLHRPFFLRSLYQHPPVKSIQHLHQSSALCVQSARTILALYAQPGGSFEQFIYWWQVAYIFSSSVVIFLHRLSQLRLGIPIIHGGQIEQDGRLLDGALALLERVQTQRSRHTALAQQSVGYLRHLRLSEAAWTASHEPYHLLLASASASALAPASALLDQALLPTVTLDMSLSMLEPSSSSSSSVGQLQLHSLETSDRDDPMMSSMLDLFEWNWESLDMDGQPAGAVHPDELVWSYDPLAPGVTNMAATSTLSRCPTPTVSRAISPAPFLSFQA